MPANLSHELQRITQFKEKANGDDQKFRQLLLTRATRCSSEKLRRFVKALRQNQMGDLAGFIEMTIQK